jgi:3-dehydroquinate dehydratase / shikimate dehydrogenase
MISITIAQESRRMALVDILNASMLGADMVEIRLDRFEKDANLGELIAAKKKPILFSCKRIDDGGHWDGAETDRQVLLRSAVMAKADYVEIELDAADQVRPFPGYQRVISYTNLAETPRDLADLYAQMQTKKPDVIKITCAASTPEAAWPLIALLNKPPVPTVVVALGPMGPMLSMLSTKMGAPWSPAALEKGMEAYPGQPTIRELTEMLRHREVDKKSRFVGVTAPGSQGMMLCGLLNLAFAEAKVPHKAVPLPVGKLGNFRKIAEAIRLQGVLFDPEHREGLHEIAAYDDTAKTPVMAADAIFPLEAGGWSATNLAGKALVAAIDATIRDRGAEGTVRGKTVMLAGVGPQTKMVAAALKDAGAVLIWASKSKESVAAACQAFGGRQILWDAMYVTSHDILVIGADGAKVESVHPGYLKPGMIVADLTANMGSGYSDFQREALSRMSGAVKPSRLMIEEVRAFAAKLGADISAETLVAKLEEWQPDVE